MAYNSDTNSPAPNPQPLLAPSPLIEAYRRRRLVVLWAELPFGLEARPPAKRVLLINRWLAGAKELSEAGLALVRLPPLAILSLDPTNRVEQAFARAGLALQRVLTGRDTPAQEGHSLLKLAGDLPGRTGLVLSRAEIKQLRDDPDKRYLLAETARITGQEGALLILGGDPARQDFRAWWNLLGSTFSQSPILALTESSSGWPPGVTPLNLTFARLVESLSAVKAQPAPLTAARLADLEQIINLKQRRLQELEKRKARSGFNTPPEVLLEIKDLQAEIGRLKGKDEG